jgi:signal transduction histidine kinase
MVEQWAAGEVSLPADLQVLTRTGEVRWLSCSHTTVAGGEGAPRSLIVVARDVTKIHDLERLKEDFVATVSHELRTPIAPIKGWASTLLEFGDRLSPDQRREAMESILRQAQRLERLVVNLLEASKIEHGRIDQIDGEVDVVPVVTRVVAEFQAAWPAREFRLSGIDGPCHSVGNELWIEQILSNLVSNAIKYSPSSEPVEVSLVERSGEIEVAVTDNGPGIPAHERERIFERFHRLEQNETQSGTGLGLYIARQLAGEIGATVTVRGAPGRGSRFSLHLRRAGRLIAVS